MTTPVPRPERSPRQQWLATLALAPAEQLLALSQPLVEGQAFETLRPAEQGLAMLSARVGGSGDRFNLGEATLARCVVRHRDGQGRAAIGVGYVLGRATARARRIAELDALLQLPTHHDAVMGAVVEPLRAGLAAAHASQRERAEASRVRFVALQRGDED